MSGTVRRSLAIVFLAAGCSSSSGTSPPGTGRGGGSAATGGTGAIGGAGGGSTGGTGGGAAGSGAPAIAYDDSSWAVVTLPHTWNAMDGEDGGSNYYRGIGWYRRHYTPPASASGKQMFLQFDGANIVADVYVNGTKVGEHRGGFARFRFDVTSQMTLGDNVIAVQVSNAAVADVPPLSADFTFFGGLYRDVHVLITDSVHVDALDFGSSGLYVTPTNVSATGATLATSVRVRNDQTTAQSVTVDTFVVRADGTIATRLSATSSVAAGANQLLFAST